MDEARTTAEDGVSVARIVEEVVGCKWAVGILDLLTQEPRRPSRIERELPGLSAKVMNERLAKLQRFGLVSRTARGDGPPFEVEYALTDLGSRFNAILDEVRRLQGEIDRAAERPAGSDPG
ncbi:MAG: helix-turn-helix domain-containing protein [Planctomycetota bacterium]